MAEQSGVRDSPYQAGAVATVEALGVGTPSAVPSAAVIEELWRLKLSGRSSEVDKQAVQEMIG